MPAGACSSLLSTQNGHFCAHHGAVHQVIAQYSEAAIVTAVLQVSVKKTVGEWCLPAIIKIHQQKGNFTENVDPAQVRIKLYAIKGCHTSIDQRDISEVQVAVALADSPCILAHLQCIGQSDIAVFTPLPQLLDRVRVV